LRVIVSSSGSSLHNLVLFLHKILVKSLSPTFSHIKNSSQLLKKLSNLHVPDECCLASFDVFLFINVPTDMVLEIIEEKWPYIEIHINLPLSEFILFTRFVLQFIYFHFNNKFYKQIFRTLMRSPLSPIVADLVLQKLESTILNNLTYKYFITDVSTTLRYQYFYLNSIVYSMNLTRSTLD